MLITGVCKHKTRQDLDSVVNKNQTVESKNFTSVKICPHNVQWSCCSKIFPQAEGLFSIIDASFLTEEGVGGAAFCIHLKITSIC